MIAAAVARIFPHNPKLRIVRTLKGWALTREWETSALSQRLLRGILSKDKAATAAVSVRKIREPNPAAAVHS